MILGLLGLLAVQLALTALPAAAAILVSARAGVRSLPILLGIGLAATSGVALLVFWGYYGDQLLGETLSYLAVLGSVAAIAWALSAGIERDLLRRLATPLALWALSAAFLVFLGFLHGGTSDPLAISSTRFGGSLPSDNTIPLFFARWFYANGYHGHPLFPPDWLASDRPPLQTGFVLAHSFRGHFEDLNYQVLGVVLQQLWVVGLWALLEAARVSRLTRALALLAVLTSDVAIVNGFYVWPKMLPTALLLAAAALILTPAWSRARRDPRLGALIAVLFGLAFLGHGGSAFGILGLAAVAAVRGLPSWRWLGVALATFLVLLLPWSAYQRYGDPPGDRLIKWQLGGTVEIDERGSLETILDSYGEAGVGGTIHNKAENVVTIFGGGPWLDQARAAIDDLGEGDLAGFVRGVRGDLFFNLVPALGLLLIAPLVMLAARRRGRLRATEWRLALACFWAVLAGAVFWVLVMFGNPPARTVMHQGTFLLPLLAFCGCVCGLRATFPRFATWYVGIASALMLALYVPALEPLPDTSYSPVAALLAAAALAGFVALALRA